MRKAYLQIHIAIFLWGFTAIFGRLIELPESLLVWYRMALTTAFLFLWLLYQKSFQVPPVKELLKISVVGILTMIHWLFFYGSIKASNVSIAVSCLSCTALFTSIFDPLYRGKKIRIREIIPGLGAIAGTYVIFQTQTLYTTGILLGLSATVLAGIFSSYNKKLIETHSALSLSFFQMITGWLFLTLILPAYLQVFPSDTLLPSSTDWLYIVLFSLFCTAIPFVLALESLKLMTPFAQNLSLNLEPIYGITLAILVFHENRELGLGFYAGTVLILGSVFLHAMIELRSASNERKKTRAAQIKPL